MPKNLITEIANRPLLMTNEALIKCMDMIEKNEKAIDVVDPSSFKKVSSREAISARVGRIGIIKIHGVIVPKGDKWSLVFDEAPIDFITEALDFFVEDPFISSIILDWDSPGGFTEATFELGNKIFEARQKKEIISVANNMAASAAYLIGSAASKFFLSAVDSVVGSIGVIAIHMDISKLHEKFGLKFTEVVSTPLKAATSPNKPLSEEGRGELQKRVDFIHNLFIEAVAINRNKSKDYVAAKMADGTIRFGNEAVESGFVDGISSITDLVTLLESSENMSDKTKPKAEETEILTVSKRVQELAQNDPEVHEAIFNSGKEKASETLTKDLENSKNEGIKEGAEAERARIKDIQAHSLPGYEKISQDAMFDGKTTGKELASSIMLKMKEDGVSLGALTSENPAVPPQSQVEDDEGEQRAQIVEYAVPTKK